MKAKALIICTLFLFVAAGAYAEAMKAPEVKAVRLDAAPRSLNSAMHAASPVNGGCDVGNLNATHWIDNWLAGQEVYKVFVDPSACGCALPGLVRPLSVSVYVYAEEGIELCDPTVMQVDIEAVDWEGGCPVPSDSVVCASPLYNVSFPGLGAYVVSLPLDPCVGLAGPFFISVSYPQPVCSALNVVIDDVPEACNSYNNWGGGWVDLVADYGFPGKLSMYATVECVTPLPATIDIDPNTLNLKSKGNYVTCYIELPAPYDPADIDVSTVLLDGVIPAEMTPTTVGDHDMDGIPDRMVKFSRSMLIASLAGLPSAGLWLDERGAGKAPVAHGDMTEMTVSGTLTDGTNFAGSDFIRVINPGGGSDPAGVAETVVLEVFPTPVSSTARISYELDVAGPVSLRVFDVAGRMVATLEDGHKDVGRHDVAWDRRTDDGRIVGPGVYFIKLDRPGGMKMQKLLVVE